MTPEKEALLTALNSNLALATFIGFVVVVLWALDLSLLHIRALKVYKKLYAPLAKYAIPIGFFATLGASIISLVYSDYLGVLPCGLCWFQRVFIYSQVFMFGYAWWKNDTKVLGYSTVLSSVGLIIALYHQSLQMGYSELIPCPTIASTIDCAKPTFIEYGFVTFPFMAVVLFAVLLLLSATVKTVAKRS
jgi:disulfide bond formation protein DsbB